MTIKIKILEKAAFNKYVEARRELRRYEKSFRPSEEAIANKKTVVAHWKAKAFPDVGYLCLQVELIRVNGRAQRHTYTDAGTIIDRLEGVELDLRKRGVTLANIVGTTVTLLSEVPTSKSYARRSRTAIASLILAERRSTGWFVTKVSKIERYTGPGGDEKIVPTISAKAREDIIKTALDGLIVSADRVETA